MKFFAGILLAAGSLLGTLQLPAQGRPAALGHELAQSPARESAAEPGRKQPAQFATGLPGVPATELPAEFSAKGACRRKLAADAFPGRVRAPVAARGGEPLPARTPQTPPHYARTGCATGGVPDPIPAEIPARPEQANRALGNRQHVGQQLEPLPGSVAGRPDNQLPDAARHESRQAHRPDESPGQDAATKTIKNSNNKELHKNGRKSTGKCG